MAWVGGREVGSERGVGWAERMRPESVGATVALSQETPQWPPGHRQSLLLAPPLRLPRQIAASASCYPREKTTRRHFHLSVSKPEPRGTPRDLPPPSVRVRQRHPNNDTRPPCGHGPWRRPRTSAAALVTYTGWGSLAPIFAWYYLRTPHLKKLLPPPYAVPLESPPRGGAQHSSHS